MLQALLWCTESYTVKSTLEEHSQWITDVRFSTSMSRLATSSADKTVRVWNADNVSQHAFLLSLCNIVAASAYSTCNGLQLG